MRTGIGRQGCAGKRGRQGEARRKEGGTREGQSKTNERGLYNFLVQKTTAKMTMKSDDARDNKLCDIDRYGSGPRESSIAPAKGRAGTTSEWRRWSAGVVIGISAPKTKKLGEMHEDEMEPKTTSTRRTGIAPPDSPLSRIASQGRPGPLFLFSLPPFSIFGFTGITSK